MDKETKDRLFEAYHLTEAEKNFIEYSKTAITKETNHSRVISTLILTKQLKSSTDEIIESNKLLAEAEDKNSKKMQWLTWALVGVGTLQAIAVLLQFF